LGKSFNSQNIAWTESRGSLTDDDGQNQEEVEKDIKKPSEGLGEIEENTIEIFLSHVKGLEQEEDLTIELSGEIMRSCSCKTDKLCVNIGIAEDKPSYGTILSEAKSFHAKYDDDCLSNEDQVELLQ